ncbi:hypothetical protein PUNSTDRAFT_134132 [Punctularia strigosozonata HHB-11173 SS5]|uniref:uncharacterized protein n=1 Tax=Punctularia strigosozonata (strain HHB-11173) TaxID=741275 RepID=UPI0004416E5D|nr:uncharacterized protein PUNSTDRAFT_134132 [Punctularia strigosozonata HHB-11173 SS5]EIN08959.1 hypothetical protein PUNSTDRAFT_134132 [Punctularia strigosozonata HHB-11173 SS5]
MIARILVITLVTMIATAAPSKFQRRDITHLVIPRDGDCAFADGTPTIPNGQRGCGPLGGFTGKGFTDAIFECNNGVAQQVDECPFKKSFLFSETGETCIPQPGQTPIFKCK